MTVASLRWMLRNRAFTAWYLVRYWRLFVLRVRYPHVVLEGMVFLGRGVRVEARPGFGRIVIGRWAHIGDRTRLHCHEGTLRLGSKVVIGSETTVTCYLDISIGTACLISDWVYVTDFDHVISDLHTPIKDQGLTKTPVRIGDDCWLGVKSSVLRGTRIGAGSVVAAHALARGQYPECSVIVGVPGRVVRDRRQAYDDDAARRAALADMALKHSRTT